MRTKISTLSWVETNNMAADMYTKRFTDPRKWVSLLYLNNIVDVDKFWAAPSYKTYIETTTKGAPFVSSYKGPTKEDRLKTIKRASPAPIIKALQRQRQADLNCTYNDKTIYDKVIRTEELNAVELLRKRIGDQMEIDAQDVKNIDKEFASREWPQQARLNVKTWAVHTVNDKRLDLLKLKFYFFFSNPISDLIEIEIFAGKQFRNSFF